MTPDREEHFRDDSNGSYTKGERAEIWALVDDLREQLKHKRQRISSWRKLLNTWIDKAKKAEAETQSVKDRANMLMNQCEHCSKGMLR